MITLMDRYFSTLAANYGFDKESFGRIGADSHRSYSKPRRRHPPCCFSLA